MIKGCFVERYDVDEGCGYHKADTIVASLTACTFAVFLPGHRDTLKGKFERCSKDTVAMAKVHSVSRPNSYRRR